MTFAEKLEARSELKGIEAGDHVAGVSTGDEQVELLAAYCAHGLVKGEHCAIAIGDRARKIVSERLSTYGFNLDALEREGRVMVINPVVFCNEENRIDIQKYYNGVVGLQAEMKKRGVKHARVTGLVGSWKELLTKKDELVLCSHMDNAYKPTPHGHLSGLCVFDSSRVAGDTLVQIIRAHPKAWIRGELVENPFFTPSADLLAEMGEKHLPH